jgi:hypothetical protein
LTESVTRVRAMLVRETLVFAGLGTSVGCALAVLLGDLRLALAIALGAAIAAANFLLLARGISRAIDRILEDQVGQPANAEPVASDRAHEAAPASPKPPRSGLRLALLLLAMLGILWYMPARPEGLAVGVFIVLLAATIAGLRRNRAI